MGNLVSVDVEGGYNKLCEDLLSNEPKRNESGCLHWATPPFKTEQLTHFMECLGKNTTLQRLVLQDMDALPAEEHPLLAKAIQEHSALTCLGFNGRLPKLDLLGVYADIFLASSTLTKFEIENSITPVSAVDSIITILEKQSTAEPKGKLTSLALKGCQMPASEVVRLAKALKESTVSATLEVLEISLKPRVPAAEAAKDLSEFFQAKDSVLQKVSLMGLLEDAVPTLMEGLKGHKSLQGLTIKGTGMNSDPAMESVGTFLLEAPSLEVVDLSHSDISSTVGAHLTKALQQSPKGGASQLRELHLSHNGLGDEGATALAKAFEQPESCTKQLQVLDLRLNQIGAPGIEMLAKVIQANTIPLQKLYLGEEAIRNSRRFEEKDADALAEMIKKNTSLQEVHMADASFHDEGLEKVLEALTENKTVKKWHIACFTTSSLQMITTALPKLHLEAISVVISNMETQIDDAMGALLLENLGKNTSLVEFSMGGFKGRCELTWKALKPKVESLLSDRKDGENETAGSKRSLDTCDAVEKTEGSAKRAKTD